MKSFVLLSCLFVLCCAQFENGHVKILVDQRYQEAARFGNFRDQEDGIRYKEETDHLGVRRGYWEYPDDQGHMVRVEFEAGPNIGFRITNSNVVPPTPVVGEQAVPEVPRIPVVPAAPRAPIPIARLTPTTTTTPGPINLFDYPAQIQVSQHDRGHRFSFKAT